MTSKTEETCRALYECVSRIRKAGKHRKLTAELQERLGEHLYQLENVNKYLQARVEDAEGRVEIYGDAHRYQVKLTHEACCRERVLFDELFEANRKLAMADSDCARAQEIVDQQKERISIQKVLIANQRQAIGQMHMLKSTMSRQITGLLEENDVLKMANKASGDLLRSLSKTGYGDAFYRVAEKLGVTGARPASPMQVFKSEILPALDSAIKDANRYRWICDGNG
jgi:hypothetical protein